MKHFFCLLLCCFYFGIAISQAQKHWAKSRHYVVEPMQRCIPIREDDLPPHPPEGEHFIGGNEAFLRYVKQNIHRPSAIREGKGGGWVSIAVKVDAGGRPLNYQKSYEEICNCPDCAKEALRLIKNIRLFSKPDLSRSKKTLAAWPNGLVCMNSL